MLRLSKDKKSVTDDQGNTVYVSSKRDGKTVYTSPTEEGGRGKKCIKFGISPKKVCIEFDGPKCISWDGIEVYGCLEWED